MAYHLACPNGATSLLLFAYHKKKKISIVFHIPLRLELPQTLFQIKSISWGRALELSVRKNWLSLLARTLNHWARMVASSLVLSSQLAFWAQTLSPIVKLDEGSQGLAVASRPQWDRASSLWMGAGWTKGTPDISATHPPEIEALHLRVRRNQKSYWPAPLGKLLYPMRGAGSWERRSPILWGTPT